MLQAWATMCFLNRRHFGVMRQQHCKSLICDLCEDSIVFYCILTLSSQLKQFQYVSMLPDLRSGRTSGYSQKHSCLSQFSFIGHIVILELYWIWAKINISVCISGACKNASPKLCHILAFRTLPCRHAFYHYFFCPSFFFFFVLPDVFP